MTQADIILCPISGEWGHERVKGGIPQSSPAAVSRESSESARRQAPQRKLLGAICPGQQGQHRQGQAMAGACCLVAWDCGGAVKASRLGVHGLACRAAVRPSSVPHKASLRRDR